jgi:exonuclease III
MMMAPTGKAAYLIKGKTVHSAFALPCNQKLDYRNLSLNMLNTFRKNLQNLKAIFIDEISMCGSNMFNFINCRLQEIMGVRKPFGGVTVICIGDLFQLRPVKDNWIFMQPSNALAMLGPNLWKDNFHMFELTRIMRQQGDQQFAEILNRLREGLQTPEDVQLLKSRCLKIHDPQYDETVPHILYYNKDVNAHNTKIWQTAENDKVICLAVDIVIGDVSQEVKETIKLKAPSKAGDAMGLAKEYITAVGLRNEMTLNLDIEDGLVNGSSCITRQIEHNDSNGASVIWVEFDSVDIGRKLRSGSTNMYGSSIIKKCWTPIKTVTREFNVGRYKNAKILRRQFPLQLCCAKTVHRSQGDTMKKAMIMLPNEKRAHMHYVALSRVTKLHNIGIIGTFDATKISVSHHVQEEMKRLRNFNSLQLCYTPLYNMDNAILKIVFHNCQSLHLHFDDICCDENILAADVILMVETKLCATDLNKDYALPAFSIYRNDYSQQRSPYGSAVYCNVNIEGKCTSLNYQNTEITLLEIYRPSRIYVACVYCRPQESIKNVCAALQHLNTYISGDIPVVIMGDFNVNILNDDYKSQQILSKMRNFGYSQLIQEITTNGHTAIDHIYTSINYELCQHGCLESYISYHKILWFAVEKDALLPTP